MRLNKTDKAFIEKVGCKLDEEVGLTRREREILDQIHDLIPKWRCEMMYRANQLKGLIMDRQLGNENRASYLREYAAIVCSDKRARGVFGSDDNILAMLRVYTSDADFVTTLGSSTAAIGYIKSQERMWVNYFRL